MYSHPANSLEDYLSGFAHNLVSCVQYGRSVFQVSVNFQPNNNLKTTHAGAAAELHAFSAVALVQFTGRGPTQ